MRPCNPPGTVPLSPSRLVATTALLSAAVLLGSVGRCGVSGFSPSRTRRATATPSKVDASFRISSSSAPGGGYGSSSSFVHPDGAGLRPGDCPYLRRMGLGRQPSTDQRGIRTALPASSTALVDATDERQQQQPRPNLPNLPGIATKIVSSFTSLDDLYVRSSTIRCPFFRRRAADLIDGAAMVIRFLIVRHKSLGVFDPLITLEGGGDDDAGLEGLLESTVRPPGWKAVGVHVRKNADGTVCKNRNLDLGTVAATIRADWEVGTDKTKGYYITGRLNSTLYRDDCLFDGPDPDMPVRGLRKYLGAASHLFDSKSSHAELASLEFEEGGGKGGNGLVVARWRLDGTLMLPWRPEVKPWTGTTRYHLDGDGLVYLHEESWDISVLEAFVCTVWPDVGERIWGHGGDGREEGGGGSVVAP